MLLADGHVFFLDYKVEVVNISTMKVLKVAHLFSLKSMFKKIEEYPYHCGLDHVLYTN